MSNEYLADMKGEKNGNCNVTACQIPGALYFNKSTKAYYCKSCADEINWPGGRADTFKLYGTELLCELDTDDPCPDCNSPTYVSHGVALVCAAQCGYVLASG